jgi:hypothetical protein
MTIIWAILAALVLYPLLGTLMFALAEKLSIPKKWKVVLLTVGHPVLTGFTVWILFLLFNRDVLTTAIFLVVGALLWAPFSNTRFFDKLNKTADELSIDYITPLLRIKNITIPLTKIQQSSVSTGMRLFDKPTILKLTLEDETIKFYVLEQNKTLALL